MIVRLAHGPEVLFTDAVQVNTLGVVQVVKRQREPGTKPSGNTAAPVGFVTKTGRGELVPICA